MEKLYNPIPMETLKKTGNTGKRMAILLVSFGIYILFHKPLEELISATVVKYLFSAIQSKWYSDIIFTVMVVYSMFFLVTKIKRYLPSLNILFLLLFSCIIYLYYRITGEPWLYTSFSAWPFLKYADTLILVTAVNALLYLFRKGNVNSDLSNNLFLSDIPLTDEKDDELGYPSYAKLLAKKIEASSFGNSFAIGINGKWGQGKSSFVNFLKENLKSQDNIHIDFNPWNSQTPNAIIKDFFDTVQEKLRPFHSSLAGLLAKYGSKITDINDNTVTKSLYRSTALITGNDSLSSLFETINNALTDLSKRVIIYIDDLDRLDKDEIVEVIRLIRNTANFHNTVFIVAYDRNYILHALKEHNPYNFEEFLEKIFQIEITLPYFKKEILVAKFANSLKQVLPEQWHDEIQNAVYEPSIMNPPYLGRWLETIRDVTRLTNSISLNLTNLLGEVEIKDFIRIELLRLKYPSVHELLFKERSMFLHVNTNNNNYSNYKYQLLSSRDHKEVNIEEEKKEKYIKIYLRRNHSMLGVPNNEINKIVDLLDDIFPDSLSYGYYKSDLLSIVYPSKIDRYFAYNLLEGNLSELKFSKARTLDSNDFNRQITKWIESGLALELSNRFLEIRAYDNQEDFEKIIKGIFHLAKHKAPANHYYPVVGYDVKDLADKLGDYQNILSDTIYSSSGGKQGLKNFIKGILEAGESPYYFEAEFTYHVLDRYFHDDTFPLTKKEMEDISIGYLEKFCNSESKIDGSLFFLFWKTQSTEYISTGGNAYRSEKSIPERAKEIIKKFILKDFDEFLLRLIEVESLRQKSFTVAKTVPTIYNSWNDFQLVLDSEDDSKWAYLKEFKEFYAECLKVDFRNYVPFDFQVIPIDEKIRKVQ